MYKHLPSGARLIHTFVWKKGTRCSKRLVCEAFKHLLMSCWSQGDTVSTDGASFPYQLLLRCDLQMKYFGWGEHFPWKSKRWHMAQSLQRGNNGGIQRCSPCSGGAGMAQRGESCCCLLFLCALCLKIKKQMAGWNYLLPLPSSGAHFMLTAAICLGLLTWTCGK